MAFFDKLSSIAKNAADKTGNIIETTKMNSKINEEKAKITALKNEIGEYYWKRFENGDPLDAEIMELCMRIQVSTQSISNLRSEIQKIKGNEVQKASEAPAATEAAVKTCSACGAEISADNKFCGQCGTQI